MRPLALLSLLAPLSLGFLLVANRLQAAVDSEVVRQRVETKQWPNLALGKPCQFFSSHESDGWSASKLTDGETLTPGWSSQAFAAYADHTLYPEFASVDLGTNCALHCVVLYPRGDGINAGKGFPRDFTVQVCREGEPWRVVVERRNYPAPLDGNTRAFEFEQTQGRYVRVEATWLREVEPGVHRFQLTELSVLGEPVSPPALARQPTQFDGPTTVGRLRCEHRDNPVGIDTLPPRFSWWMQSSARGQRQTAYRIRAASTQAGLQRDEADVWDSGKVASDREIAVVYAGRPLRSGQSYWWKVKLWDRDGKETAWSEAAWFMTGKLKPEDWQGQWIGADTTRAPTPGILGFAAEARAAETVEWVQVDLGSAVKLDRVVLHPMFHEDPAAGGWIRGYGFPLRFRLEVSDDASFETRALVVDQTQADYPNPGWAEVAFDAGGRSARYVRLTVTKLWRRGPGLPFVYTLGEMQVFSDGRNAALKAPVAASASVEQSGWAKNQLTDGLALCPPPAGPEATKARPARFPHGTILLRKEITIAKPVRRATVFFSGLGFSELYLNGRKIGDYVVGPGFTTYNKRVPYLAFEVTEHFTQIGRKALGVILADGWYGNGYGHNFERNVYVDQPKLLLNLHLEYADGTEAVVASDGSWKWADGEITYSGIVQEDIDRREACAGWNQTGYDERDWQSVAILRRPEGQLTHQQEPPCKIVEEIRPVSLRYDPQANATTFDFGREFCGWVRFRTSGPPGTSVSITTLPTVALPRTSHFTLAGGGDEVYEPRFFYAGMRQVVIQGAAHPPALEDLTGCLVSMSWAPSGSFRCSDDVANWLHDATRRTVVAYTTFLPNDPVREWKAWMQDPQNMFWSTAYLFDAQTMYERWQRDILDGQRPDGSSPNIAPGAYFDAYNSPWWGGCLVWVPWHWYQYYGDSSLLAASYPAMKRYVDFLGRAAAVPGEYAGRIAEDGIQDWGLSDWCPIEETARPIINTPAYFLYATIVSRAAKILGLDAEVRHYAELAQSIRAAFNRRFLDPATGIYGSPGGKAQDGYPIPPVGGQVPHVIWWTGDRPCTQAGQALPLALGLAPEESRPAVKRALLREIAAHRNRVSTGFVSTPYLLSLLADEAPEVGWEMTSARDYPSWYGMTIGSDQDLMKETWAGGQALMPSLGGNIVAWYHQALGGIRPDPAGPGFKRFIIKPNVVGNLHWVKSAFDSAHGRIISHWRRREGQLTMDLTLPPNTIATVFVPAKDGALVTESGQPANAAAGVKFLRMENHAAVYAVASGTYCFGSTLPENVP